MSKRVLPGSAATLVLALTVIAPAAGDQTPEVDCTDLSLDYVDPDYPYTDLELMELRSRALREGLSAMETCIRDRAADGTSGDGGGAGGAGGAGGGSGGAGSGGSTGTSDGPVAGNIQGTEPVVLPGIAPRPDGASGAGQTTNPEEMPLDGSPVVAEDRTMPPSPGNGAPPEKIGEVNNDDAVAWQIRRAAEAETDPVRKQALWDEYYRYTGRKPPP